MKTLLCILLHRRSYFEIATKVCGKWHRRGWCDICHREWAR
jgi:hypothetical protein